MSKSVCSFVSTATEDSIREENPDLRRSTNPTAMTLQGLNKHASGLDIQTENILKQLSHTHFNLWKLCRSKTPISKGDLESVFTKVRFWRPGVSSRIQLSAAWSHLKFQSFKFYNQRVMKKGASWTGHSPLFQQGSRGRHFLFGCQRTHLHNTQALQKQTVIN